MKVALWRVLMLVVAMLDFVWLVVAVPADWVTRGLRAWADAAEIGWLIAVAEAAFKHKRNRKGL